MRIDPKHRDAIYAASNEVVYRPALNRERTVIVACDIEEDSKALVTLFRLEGFNVIPVRDPSSALSVLESGPVSALIVSLDAQNASALLEIARSQYLGIGVFLIAKDYTTDETVAAMRAGAYDVLQAPINPERLIKSVGELMRANTYVMPPVNGHREVIVRGFPQLTPREREVVQLIINGFSNKEAGIRLKISPRTVEVHRARIMEKIGARNTADLIRIALTS
ncbi:response regulator transcription factor [Pelagibacterium sediminicola]|uniref:response regulator transcription factor n=1 Tax=Pelagibacterium sediminicola TaxID=2248761 RepID=UPI000E30FB77|nr:LuxR C-terminal-related transcriptional regulator [Pelagibacterium sediminicola]